LIGYYPTIKNSLKRFDRMREYFLKLIKEDTTVEKVQKYFGIEVTGPKEFKIHNKFWFYLFTFGASLGNELFYLAFFPVMVWADQPMRAIKMILGWCFAMYVGQSLKDIFRLPRPDSPNIAKLENHYETEYGLPSTHAMVAINMPLYLSYLICQDNSNRVVTTLSVIVAVTWAFVMSLSRFYMGVHSTLDVVTGIGLGFIILFINILYVDVVLNWIVEMPIPQAFLVVIGFGAFLVWIYPRKMGEKWNNTYGDTTLIVGCSFASLMSVNICVQSGMMEILHHYKSKYVPFILLKAVLGFSALLVTRAVFKAISLAIFVRLAPKSDENPSRRYVVEIPTKAVTYAMIGFNAWCGIPFVFTVLGIK
jgi:sphingosine-1-phosphate phosphatase 1